MGSRHRVVLGVGLVSLLVGCSGGGGGNRAQAPLLGDDTIASAQVVATTGPDLAPTDAVPSPDGAFIYFTANGPGGPAILRVPGTGGTTSTLTSGAPLVKPVGVTVATDGSRIFVADPQAGGIFSAPAAGGSPTVVAGTEGRSPHGLDVVSNSGTDVIYFTGTDPADAAAGLFSVPAAGGAVTVVAKGAPLVSPDAVVYAGRGVAYVTDRGASADQGAVFKVSLSGVVKVAGVRLGDPGGVSVTSDGKTLLVSSQNAATGADQLLLIDVATGQSGVAGKVIGANHNSSGGLHRAHRAAALAWADTRFSGRVYRVVPVAP